MDEKKDLKTRKDELVNSLKVKGSKVADFVTSHKEITAAAITVLVPAAIDIAKIVSKRKNLDCERRLKECMVYDRNHGHYIETKRKLTSEEWAIVDSRKDLGENLSEILRSLNLTK